MQYPDGIFPRVFYLAYSITGLSEQVKYNRISFICQILDCDFQFLCVGLITRYHSDAGKARNKFELTAVSFAAVFEQGYIEFEKGEDMCLNHAR